MAICLNHGHHHYHLIFLHWLQYTMHVRSFLQRYLSFLSNLNILGYKLQYCTQPFFKKRHDLPGYPEFVSKIKSYNNTNNYEIPLHGLYHEDKKVMFDKFHSITEWATEEQLRAALRIFLEIDTTLECSYLQLGK